MHTVLPKIFLSNAVIKFMVKLGCELFRCGCRRNRIWGGGWGDKNYVGTFLSVWVAWTGNIVSVRSVGKF